MSSPPALRRALGEAFSRRPPGPPPISGYTLRRRVLAQLLGVNLNATRLSSTPDAAGHAPAEAAVFRPAKRRRPPARPLRFMSSPLRVMAVASYIGVFLVVLATTVALASRADQKLGTVADPKPNPTIEPSPLPTTNATWVPESESVAGLHGGSCAVRIAAISAVRVGGRATHVTVQLCAQVDPAAWGEYWVIYRLKASGAALWHAAGRIGPSESSFSADLILGGTPTASGPATVSFVVARLNGDPALRWVHAAPRSAVASLPSGVTRISGLTTLHLP